MLSRRFRLGLISLASASLVIGQQVFLSATLVQAQIAENLPAIKEAEWDGGTISYQAFPNAQQACEYRAAAFQKPLKEIKLLRSGNDPNGGVYAVDCITEPGFNGIVYVYCNPPYYYGYVGGVYGVCVNSLGYIDTPLGINKIAKVICLLPVAKANIYAIVTCTIINAVIKNLPKSAKQSKRVDSRDDKGGFPKANETFDSLGLKNVQNKGNGIREGKLPDGRSAIVRPFSGKDKKGPPTLEFQNADGTYIKVRYLP